MLFEPSFKNEIQLGHTTHTAVASHGSCHVLLNCRALCPSFYCLSHKVTQRPGVEVFARVVSGDELACGQDHDDSFPQSNDFPLLLHSLVLSRQQLISAVMMLLHHFHFWVCSIVIAWEILCLGLLLRMWHAERLCPSTHLA